LVSWHEALSAPQGAPTQIDEWGDYIWFLYGRSQSCKAAGHTGRMVRVGNAITPIVFPYDDRPSGWRPVEEQAADQVEAVHRIQTAIALLVGVLELEERDPLTALVYRLVAGRVKPEQAIADIRDMFDRQVAGALVPDELWRPPAAVASPVMAGEA
jgi:hypothetical protein